jgi:hypothetical protein
MMGFEIIGIDRIKDIGGEKMKEKKVKQQLVTGCILFIILIISGSTQIVFSPYSFVRNLSLIAVIGCSIGLGAFIRELFIHNAGSG